MCSVSGTTSLLLSVPIHPSGPLPSVDWSLVLAHDPSPSTQPGSSRRAGPPGSSAALGGGSWVPCRVGQFLCVPALCPDPISINVFNMANSAATADHAGPLLCASTKELDFICRACKSPVNVFISFSPSCPPFTPLSWRPKQQLAPPRQPEPSACTPALRFGLIFVLLSFSCASPCAVIYNLPLLSGLTGSSGVTALAARTASTSQSQQHDGTPQSGKRTVARPPAGGRGAPGGQSQQRKNKNQNVL